jgi:hypothetical protein
MNASLETTIALPTIADVDAAAAKLKGVAIRTPLLNFPVLDARINARVYLKAETLQRTGSLNSAAPTTRFPRSRATAKLRAWWPIRPAITRRAWRMRPSFAACRRRS